MEKKQESRSPGTQMNLPLAPCCSLLPRKRIIRLNHIGGQQQLYTPNYFSHHWPVSERTAFTVQGLLCTLQSCPLDSLHFHGTWTVKLCTNSSNRLLYRTSTTTSLETETVCLTNDSNACADRLLKSILRRTACLLLYPCIAGQSSTTHCE